MTAWRSPQGAENRDRCGPEPSAARLQVRHGADARRSAQDVRRAIRIFRPHATRYRSAGRVHRHRACSIHNQECKYADFSAMHISHRVKFSPTVAMNSRTGGIESAFLFCDGSYFTGREAISFNSDGFIGFCGWADDKNSMPFLVAFYRWVNDWLDNSFGGHYREITEVDTND